jgi:hypothetical protein
MQIHDALNKALLLIGEQRRAADSAGRGADVALWRHLLEHVNFTILTGQVYKFEDYLKSLDDGWTSSSSAILRARTEAAPRREVALLLQTLDELTDPEKRQSVLVLGDLLDFIAAPGRHEEFEDYLKKYYTEPPPLTAYFETLKDAESWLSGLSEPPSWASVLVGDEYYEVWYSREEGTRALLRDFVTELFLDDFESKDLPPAVVSFDTRDQALQWLVSHPAAPMALVTIGGEYYHAVYHRRLDRHSLHAISRIREWRRKRREEVEQQGEDGAVPPKGGEGAT